MRENPYKRLPPIERKQDGSLYRMTPAQRKQANPLIRRECCNYEDGNCMLLDKGYTLMERAKLESELKDIQRLVDRIPPEVLAELKRQQRHTRER